MHEYIHGNILLHIFISVQSISAQPKIYFPFYIISSSLSTQKPVAQISSFLRHLHLNVSTNKLIILSLKQDNGLPLYLPIYVKNAILGLCRKWQKLNWTKWGKMIEVGGSKTSGMSEPNTWETFAPFLYFAGWPHSYFTLWAPISSMS